VLPVAKHAIGVLVLAIVSGAGSVSAVENRYVAPVQYRAFEQEYDDGVCRIERRLNRNGTFREERECRNLPGPVAGRRAFKEEYDDGICEVERELERDGDYREERVCRPGRHRRSIRGIGY
jgi:hypothetical protein